jgi:hypothetical protein
MTAARARRPARPGVAAVWVLVVLAVIAALSAAAVSRNMAGRRQVDAYRNRVQAEWLTRAGFELAAARLLTDPKDYTGETATPVPGGEVKIVVQPDPRAKGVYRVECTARVPADNPAPVVRSASRKITLTDDPRAIRVEP